MAGSTAFDTPTALEGALSSLSLLEQSTDEVEILGALPNQDVDESGALIDVVDVYWSLPGRPGFFTSRVGFDLNWQAQAFFWIGVKQALVRGIYAGLASKADLPAGPVGAPVPQPGVPF